MRSHGEARQFVSAGGPGRRRLSLRIGLFLLLALVMQPAMPLMAQSGATATPLRARLLTPTPELIEASAPSATPTLSPSPPAAARLRARDAAGNVNIRALPSLESEILGTLGAGVEYAALRSYYRWFEFRYDLSPSGRGWVYGDLVEIIGERAKIIVIDNPSDIAAPVDAQSLAEATATQPRAIAISTLRAGSDAAVELSQATPLPTFTPPAATPAAFTEQGEPQPLETPPWTDLPPIAPIAALGALGLLGFLLNALRR